MKGIDMFATDYLKEKARMCKAENKGFNCPMEMRNNGANMPCRVFEENYPDKAVIIVDEWSRQHPIVTNREKFAEVFGAMSFAAFVWNNLKSGGYDEWWDKEYKAPTSPIKESEEE